MRLASVAVVFRTSVSTTVAVEVYCHKGGVVTDRPRASSDRLLLLKCCFTSAETVGLLGTGAEDVHLDFQTAPEL